LSRLLDVIETAATAPENEYSTRLVCATYTVIWLLGRVAPAFLEEIMASETLGSVTQDLILDSRLELRRKISAILSEACSNDQYVELGPSCNSLDPLLTSSQRSHANKVAEFIWPYIASSLPRLAQSPVICIQGFEMLQFLIITLTPKSSHVLDLPRLAEQCANLLLGLNSTEVRASV
jgi:hypothetical protein